MVGFDLKKPKTVDEALDILNIGGQGFKILAGGTDLLVEAKDGKAENECMVFIGDIGALKYIREDAEGLHIGACATIGEIEEDSVIREKYAALSEAAGLMANTQVRNLGTVGGNICTASPAGDTIAPLLVFDAQVEIASKEGRRRMPLEKFFAGPKKTVLKPGEMLAEILLPPQKLVSAYERLGTRKASSISICGCAAALEVSGGAYKTIRIAFSSVAPTVVRSYELEEALAGKKVDSIDFDHFEKYSITCINPIVDRRASKWYRCEVAKALAKKAIIRATETALGGESK
jgi:CO/xanthine dehydrogenase FAD-binding subunit